MALQKQIKKVMTGKNLKPIAAEYGLAVVTTTTMVTRNLFLNVLLPISKV